MLFDKRLNDKNKDLSGVQLKLKIHIPKVTIDEEEFVRLKLSDFVSS